MGKKYTPTEEHRKAVMAASAVGMKQDDICLVLGITGKTLRKHYPEEIKIGMLRANIAVGGAMFNAATKPSTAGHVTAGIWWTKTRMGWKEPAQAVEHSGPNGEAVQVRQITRIIIDPRAPDPAPKARSKTEGDTEG